MPVSQRSFPPTFRLVAIAVVLVGIATLADPLAYRYLAYPRIYEQNWGRLLRTMGYLPFWLLAGIAFHRVAHTAALRRRAVLLLASPTIAGALSEILKLLVRRERPTAADGAYVFLGFGEHPFSTGRFGMPSGDATVAFAACAVLARVWPQARGLWYLLAAGCALARVMSHAHFLSDVTAAALLGWAVADWAWHRYALLAPAVT